MSFIDYIASLAPENETALFVLQKPQLFKGEQQYHNDGTLKCTWPAFLPGKVNQNAEQAWYGNTGSFITSRFKNGKPSASAAYCTHVLVMMLDDIGIKSKTPPLPPSWIMETSAGSFQWGYIFSEQPTKQAFVAAIKAIAAAGYTDPGAINAVRNFRLPGSVNLKPGRDNFRAVLIEFNPKREYTLDEICTALNVTPYEKVVSEFESIRLPHCDNDPVLKWLSDKGLILSNVNNEGWLGVVCPNHNQHSDGNPMARYKPATHGFCCYHGHCAGLTSNIFLEWVKNNGGPEAEYGVSEKVLSKNLFNAMEKIDKEVNVSDAVKAVLKSIKTKEIARLEKTEWYSRFAYIKNEDCYFDMETREVIKRITFDAIYRHVECRSIFGNRVLSASRCFDENREAHGAKVFVGVTYAAGETVACKRGGELYANIWRDARARDESKDDVDISPWLNHCRRLVPEEKELNHILDMMAFKLQNPAIKINHAVLHGGAQGCGKDTMWAPFVRAICGYPAHNLGIVDNDTLSGQWGDAFESEVLIINELYDPDFRERRALANRLKPIIAAPPDLINVNKKFQPVCAVMNRMFVLAFSNERIPIRLDSQDRRWFYVWSTAPKMTDTESKQLWDWYHATGFAAVAEWLHTRDVSQFNPGMHPPMTDAKFSLVEYSRSNIEAEVVGMLVERRTPFNKGIIGSPFNKLCESIGTLSNSPPISRHVLFKALEEAGWIDCGRIKSRTNPNAKHIFIHPDLCETYTQTELRDMVEISTPFAKFPNKEDNIVPIARSQTGSQK